MALPEFHFSESFGDARVEELKLLTWVSQVGTLALQTVPSGAWNDLLVYLVWNDYLTTFNYESAKVAYFGVDAGNHRSMIQPGCMPGETVFERMLNSMRIQAVEKLHMGVPVELRLTQFGRVRLSELQQELRSGRDRDPYGIMWDGRHFDRDLQVALTEIKDDTPVSLAFLDMNGLKEVNDKWGGHATGGAVLKTYLQVIDSAIGRHGQAYKIGGDEVLVFFPGRNAQASIPLLEAACRKFMKERFESLLEGKGQLRLSISVGVITCLDRWASTEEVKEDADKAMYRAKELSRVGDPRPSVIAVEIDGETKIITHEDKG